MHRILHPVSDANCIQRPNNVLAGQFCRHSLRWSSLYPRSGQSAYVLRVKPRTVLNAILYLILAFCKDFRCSVAKRKDWILSWNCTGFTSPRSGMSSQLANFSSSPEVWTRGLVRDVQSHDDRAEAALSLAEMHWSEHRSSSVQNWRPISFISCVVNSAVNNSSSFINRYGKRRQNNNPLQW